MFKRAPLAALALATVLLALAIGAILSRSSGHGAPQPAAARSSRSELDGAVLPGAIAAPDFTLRNQYGRRVSLGDYRGRVVLLAGLYSTCGDTCIVIAQQIRGALDELQSEHAKLPAVLIVSADPAADSAAHVRSFLAEVSLTGRVQYLRGSRSQLRAVWRAYRIEPASTGRRTFDEYASVLLIDPQGNERVLYESEELTPEALAHDIGRLEGERTHP
jgi:protein SCO1/2